MSRVNRVSGFTLITAIFLLVVVAGLSVYMINLRSVQQITVVFGLQGARAMQAAKAGIEWGIYDSIVKGNCTTTSFNAPGFALQSFTIDVNCSSTNHTEGVLPPITVYRLTSTATTGTYGTLDYVFRRLQATVSNQPP